MPKNRQLTEALVGYLLLFWCASVLAARSAFEEGISEISGVLVIAICLMGGAGGVVSTLSKVCVPDHKIKNVPLEMFKDLSGSIVFAWLVFFFTIWLPYWMQCGLIIMAGFGGATALNSFVGERLQPVLGSILERVFGKVTKD